MSSKPDPKPAADDQPQAKSGKRKLILIAAPLVLLIGVGAGLWFTGILPGLLGMKHEEHNHEAAKSRQHRSTSTCRTSSPT